MLRQFRRALAWGAEYYAKIYFWSHPAAKDDLRETFFQTLLRRRPYAAFAHLAWGRHRLEFNDTQAAYASALAVLEIAAGEKRFWYEANHLLSECLLKTGQFERAKEKLLELISLLPDKMSLKEDLAAAELGLENFSEARRILESIGEDRLSASGHEVLKYLRRLERGDLYT